MAYSREPIDYNPGFPSRSPSPPQFPEYSLWGDPSPPYNFSQAPHRPGYPRGAEDGHRPFYRSADDHLKGSRNHAWPPFTPDPEEQRSKSFRNLPPQWSPNQFVEEQIMQPQLRPNIPQYDEQRFSVSPDRPDRYSRSPFQSAMQYSEGPPPLMSMHIHHPQFLSTEISDDYRQNMFEPAGEYNQHQILRPTESPQYQLQPRFDDHTDLTFPLYQSCMKFDKDLQLLMPQQSQLYRHRSPLQRPDEHIRSTFPTSDIHHRSRYYDEDSQSQSYRLRSPLQRPDNRSQFRLPEMRNSARNYDKNSAQPLMPSRFQSQLLRRDEQSTPQFQPSEQQYNSINFTEDSTRAKSLLGAREQYTEEVLHVMLSSKKRTLSQELGMKSNSTCDPINVPSNQMVPIIPPEDIVIEEEPKPELAVSEEPELDVVIIERKSLYLHPDNFQFVEDIDELPGPQEQASTSSGSSGEWTSTIFKREGAPSSQSHQPSRTIQPRERKTNSLNRKLVKALSQPVKMEKGAKMMQRMGWIGGGLGKDGTGIVDPIAPNAIYATTTVGFGQEVKAIQRLPTKRENRSPCIKRNKSKKMHTNSFKANVLLHLLKFATNDKQVELHFETLLNSTERKRIHRIVEAIGKEETGIHFGELFKIVKEIRRRCRFKLCTQSDGGGEQRMLCVFKEAPEHMFIVTPDDCRPCLTDINVDEDEPNPFLRSIKNHIKENPESASPAPTYLIDKLVELFLEFCENEEYTEFRFLGPFRKNEVIVIDCFLELIEDLSRLVKPDYVVPIELLEAFHTDNRFYPEMDANRCTSIKKILLSTTEGKKSAKDGDKSLCLHPPVNHWSERVAWRTKELLHDDKLT